MKINRTIKENLVQVILIVFSVVLGLYLSERIEERKKVAASKELLQKISHEVRDNMALLQDWYPYHEGALYDLDSLLKEPTFLEAFIDDKSVFFRSLFTRGTFMGRSPGSDTWDIAKSHPLVVNIDYDKLVALSRIYNQQKITYEAAFDMFDILNTRDVNVEQNAKANLVAIRMRLREFVAREKQLLFYYQRANKILALKDAE